MNPSTYPTRHLSLMPSGPKPAPTNAAPPFCLTASELLDALIELHSAMAADQSGYEERDELYQLVTSAIAKAEGESEATA